MMRTSRPALLHARQIACANTCSFCGLNGGATTTRGAASMPAHTNCGRCLRDLRRATDRLRVGAGWLILGTGTNIIAPPPMAQISVCSCFRGGDADCTPVPLAFYRTARADCRVEFCRGLMTNSGRLAYNLIGRVTCDYAEVVFKN